MNIVDIISGDQSLIIYRPMLTKITGSVNSALLLSQILHRWKKNKKKPFYKFKAPCKHTLYEKGDSWIEELGFTKREYENAMSKISIKLTSTNKSIKHNKYIEYWTSPYRVTYYNINTFNLDSDLAPLYGLSPQRGFNESPKGTYQRGFSNTKKVDPEEFSNWDALNILDDIVNSPKSDDFLWMDKIAEKELLGKDYYVNI